MKAEEKLNEVRDSFVKFCANHRFLNFVVHADTKRQANEYSELVAETMLNEKAVFFEAFSGNGYACSPKALYKALCADERFDDWTFYWSFKNDSRPLLHEVPELARAIIVRPNTPGYLEAFATCKYWIRNNRAREFVTPRPEQVYVQTWHGTPLKALGLDAREVKGGSFSSGSELARQNVVDARKWSYLISPSPFVSEHLTKAFGVDEKRKGKVVIEEGYPRNDELVRNVLAPDAEEIRSDIKGRLGIPEDKKILLYAPTWRDDQRKEGGGYYFDMPLDLDLMREKLGGEWVVLARMHTLVSESIDLSPWSGFVFDVSDVTDINDLYCIADALCTDYSSVFFDFANTARPLYFFWADYDHYRNELHDFYLDIEELPGPKCKTTEELIEELQRGENEWKQSYGAAYEVFQQTFCPLDDGAVSDRVIKKVFSL